MKSALSALKEENSVLRAKGEAVNGRLREALSALSDKLRVKTVMLNDQNESIESLRSDKKALKATIDAISEREAEIVRENESLRRESAQFLEERESLEELKLSEREHREGAEEANERLKEKEAQMEFVTCEV